MLDAGIEVGVRDSRRAAGARSSSMAPSAPPQAQSVLGGRCRELGGCRSAVAAGVLGNEHLEVLHRPAHLCLRAVRADSSCGHRRRISHAGIGVPAGHTSVGSRSRAVSRCQRQDHRGTVAALLEQSINGVEDMLYMESKASGDGHLYLTVTFSWEPIRTGRNSSCRPGFQAQPRLPRTCSVWGSRQSRVRRSLPSPCT